MWGSIVIWADFLLIVHKHNHSIPRILCKGNYFGLKLTLGHILAYLETPTPASNKTHKTFLEDQLIFQRMLVA